MIQGQNISLRKTQVSDAGKSSKWLNDPDVTRYLGVQGTVTPESRKKFLKKHLADSHEVNFSIIENKSGDYIGNVYIYNINREKKSGELGIFIGEKGVWGKGYGSEAIDLLFQYISENFGLHEVYAQVERENIPAQKCYVKAGFEDKGLKIMQRYLQ